MTQRAVTTAGVVVVIAVTPTLIDAYQGWQKPELRAPLLAWYAFVGLVAVSAYRYL